MLVFRYNRIWVALIGIGLIAALAVFWQRHEVEQANTRLEIVTEYEQIVDMSRIDGVPLQESLRRMKAAGLTTLAIYETTLEKLHATGVVTAVSTTNMLHGYHAGTLTDWWWRNEVESGRLAAGQMYVMARENDRFDEVVTDITRRAGPKRVREFKEGARRFLIVDAPYESLLYWNLGLPMHELQTAASNGLKILARPTNYSKVKPDDIKSVFARIDAAEGAVTGLHFVGAEVLGFPDQLPMVAQEMKKRGLYFAMVEHFSQLQFAPQDGSFQLAELNDYAVVRLHMLQRLEQPKLSVQEAVHRQVLGSRERNIRVQYLKMFERPLPGMNLTETHVYYIKGVKDGLTSFGVPVGPATTFPPFRPHPVLLFLVTLGTVAAGVLLLSVVIPVPRRVQYGLFAVLTAALGIPLFVGSAVLARQMTAFGAAIIFPVLAMTWQFDVWRATAPRGGASMGKVILDGVTGLTRTFLCSMVGGLYLGAVLADTRFLLEMDIYRGVKLTFVLPPILIAIVYLTRFNLFPGVDADDSRHLWQKLLHVLDYPAYIKTLIAFAAVGSVAYVFVGRSGHSDGVPVPEFEIKLRRFLETWMYARPREKEFVIGHPAFMMAVLFLYRGWPRFMHFGMAIAATIGQGSLVETFAHMRTPVLMSVVRGFDGILLGVALGILAVVGMQILHTLTFLLGRRLHTDD